MKTVHIVIPEKIGNVSPEIYGHFSELIGGVFYDGLWVGKNSDIPNIRGFRKDLIEKLREIKPAVFRWPGGCFAETYNWRDGIGENRPVRPSWWTLHDGRYEKNEVGIHEFMDLCELIGAKAYIAMNVTSITPMEARNFMDYCLSPRGSTTLALEREANGRPEPFEIDYWGIGNENWGGGGNMTPEYYALEYRKFATVLKAICGNKSKLILGGADASDYKWTHGIMSGLANSYTTVDGMSFHYYCREGGDAVNFADDEWYRLINNAGRMEELIKRHYSIAAGYGMENKAKLVIDEWGCWHPDGSGPSKGYNLYEQQSTLRDAMVAALTLNIFNNYSEVIIMANIAQLCNNIQSLFLAGGEHCIVTPTYHVFNMFKDHQGGEALRVVIDNNEDEKHKISASATVKDGTLTVTLANISLEVDEKIDLSLLGYDGVVGECEMTVLSSEDIHSCNTFEHPNTVVPVTTKVSDCRMITLPRASIVKLSIKML
ncbi:MAG: alpha-N-arabinofuranosidase [Clostridia bacterium]|nr:alpha-N-arabinofuranosidase [Clostridia bacterium]